MRCDCTLYCDACEQVFRIPWRELEKNPPAVGCPRCGRQAKPILLARHLTRDKIRFEHVVDGDPDPEVHIHECIQRCTVFAIGFTGLLLTVSALMVAPLLCPAALVVTLIVLLLYIVFGMRRFLRSKPIAGAMRIIRKNLAPLIWQTPMLGTVRP